MISDCGDTAAFSKAATAAAEAIVIINGSQLLRLPAGRSKMDETMDHPMLSALVTVIPLRHPESKVQHCGRGGRLVVKPASFAALVCCVMMIAHRVFTCPVELGSFRARDVLTVLTGRRSACQRQSGDNVQHCRFLDVWFGPHPLNPLNPGDRFVQWSSHHFWPCFCF